MKFNYQYQGKWHSSKIDWTENDRSVVFQNIKKELAARHKLKLTACHGLAVRLDGLMDKLYLRLYDLPEHQNNTYNPAYDRLLEEILGEIHCGITSLPEAGEGGILYALYSEVFKKVCEIAEVFFDDNRYQNKILKHYEYSIETTWEQYLSTEFEDTLLYMTDFSNYLNCLTETQRRRLVQHVFMKYTLQEIAKEEGTSHVAVRKSVESALKKLRVKGLKI